MTRTGTVGQWRVWEVTPGTLTGVARCTVAHLIVREEPWSAVRSEEVAACGRTQRSMPRDRGRVRLRHSWQAAPGDRRCQRCVRWEEEHG